MRHLLQRFWSDDAGALIPTEFLFVATILILGIISGLVLIRDALNGQLAEFANAIGALNQSYFYTGVVDGCGHVATPGSAAGPDFCRSDVVVSSYPYPCPVENPVDVTRPRVGRRPNFGPAGLNGPGTTASSIVEADAVP